ncbi:MAG: choice-of-anchor J domain-containing protein [Micromonosporaceae bacterium]
MDALPMGANGLAAEFAEGFEDITLLPSRGWAMINNSQPRGFTSWYRGVASLFPAHEGPQDSSIAADFENVDLIGTISNWLITPPLTLQNGDTFTF